MNSNSDKNRERLLKLLENFKACGSNREDIVSFFKLHLIFYYAIKANFTRVLFGTCGQRIASKVFSLFSKGRGFSLENEVAPIDLIKLYADEKDLKIFKEIGLCRPMKDMLN